MYHLLLCRLSTSSEAHLYKSMANSGFLTAVCCHAHARAHILECTMLKSLPPQFGVQFHLPVHVFCFGRDKKSRRAEKQKGKGKKEEGAVASKPRQGSPNGNDQNGDDVVVEPPPPVHEEVALLFLPLT